MVVAVLVTDGCPVTLKYHRMGVTIPVSVNVTAYAKMNVSDTPAGAPVTVTLPVSTAR
jgi:S-adenosylmethionine synthetase